MIRHYIDNTNLKSYSTYADIVQLCEEAKLYGMAAVCVLPCRVRLASDLLRNSGVKVCTVVGFPLGGDITATKLYATRQALLDGADEIDIVIDNGAVKDGNYNLVENELKIISRLKREYDFILKVIVETALLSEVELITLTRIISNLECDYIKTSTGFSTRGVTIEDINIIKQHKSPALKIKASGGIGTYDLAKELIDLGVERIGTSSAILIINEGQSGEDY